MSRINDCRSSKLIRKIEPTVAIVRKYWVQELLLLVAESSQKIMKEYFMLELVEIDCYCEISLCIF